MFSIMGFSAGALALPGIFFASFWFFASRNWLRGLGSHRRSWWTEWPILALVPLLGAAAYWPFNYNGLLGVGDSYHYTLQVTDAVTQARLGHWPIMAGQSAYAFNGNVHTLRTAPYFTHVAAALDLLSGHRLEFWQLTNLIVLGSGAMGGWLAYVCARWLAPDARLLAGLLALLYELSPALGTPLMNHDMIATFVATPWLPLVCASAVQCARDRSSRPWLLLAFSLGLTWLAHPPTAIWITPFAVIAGGVAVFKYPLRRTLCSALGAVCLFAALTGYVFYGVHALNVPGASRPELDSFAAAVSNIAASWPDAWKPLDQKSMTSGNIQLGYALWLSVVFGALALPTSQRKFSAVGVMAYFAFLLSCIAPLPLYSAWFWSHVPNAVMVVTNNWPMQRIYAVLASLAVVFVATSMSGSAFAVRRLSYAIALAGLAFGLIWSGLEYSKLQTHAVALRRTTSASAMAYAPDQFLLTRSSYALFDSPPTYYSHSWMDPEMESRLLGQDGRVLITNDTFVEHASPPAMQTKLAVSIDQPFTLDLSPETDYLFVFSFPRPEIPGEVTLQSEQFSRAYALPLSGQPGSFGSAEISQHTFRLGTVASGQKTYVLHAPPGTRVDALRFSRDRLPVQVRGLTPYRATVVSPSASFLETPLMFIPGYSAQVNGKDVEVVHSPQGLVAIPLAPGISNVSVRYPGPPGLRFAGWLATLGFLVGAAVLARGPLSEPKVATTENAANKITAEATNKNRLLLLGAFIVVGVVAGFIWKHRSPTPKAGRIRMAVQFPSVPLVPAEPLVVTGKQGAANALYVIYGDNDFRLGLDIWGKGGPISEPIPLSFIHRNIVEYESPGLELGSPSPPEGPVRVRVDGKIVLETTEKVHPAAKGEFYLGKNPVGASVCSERFTGWLEWLP